MALCNVRAIDYHHMILDCLQRYPLAPPSPGKTQRMTVLAQVAAELRQAKSTMARLETEAEAAQQVSPSGRQLSGLARRVFGGEVMTGRSAGGRRTRNWRRSSRWPRRRMARSMLSTRGPVVSWPSSGKS
jgi:hypothetical protein